MRILARLAALLRASHPEPTVAVTVTAALLAVATGRSVGGILAVAAAVLAGQLSIGWSNDYRDAARDRVSGRPDKPIPAGRIGRRAVGLAALVAAAATVPLSLLSGPLAGGLHVLAVASAWAYNLAFKATALSVLPYLVSFGLLPAFVVLGLPGRSAPAPWLVAAGSLLGGAAHFANVLPDLQQDLATGVRGLPHRIGPTASRFAAGTLLLAASAVLVSALPATRRVLGAAVALGGAVMLGVGLVAGRRPGSRAAFRAVLVVAAIDVLLLLAAGAGGR